MKNKLNKDQISISNGRAIDTTDTSQFGQRENRGKYSRDFQEDKCSVETISLPACSCKVVTKSINVQTLSGHTRNKVRF